MNNIGWFANCPPPPFPPQRSFVVVLLIIICGDFRPTNNKEPALKLMHTDWLRLGECESNVYYLAGKL